MMQTLKQFYGHLRRIVGLPQYVPIESFYIKPETGERSSAWMVYDSHAQCSVFGSGTFSEEEALRKIGEL